MIKEEDFMAKNEKKPVIGLDFGNCNSFTCYISDFDEDTRMGGIVHDLLPPGELSNTGIPSVYYYSEKKGVLCGEAAVSSLAKPVRNRVNCLKRHLGERFNLDGKNFSYDEAVTAVIEHCVRRANEQLESGWMVTTNQIALSYPAGYTCAQRQRLIELAEKATLSDGTKVTVYGTIAEPAAAALDYLAEFARTDRDTTVLTYDLGGGTFDLALVSAYPSGRKNAEGETYYYDIIDTDALSDVGGTDFDEIMYGILNREFKLPEKPIYKEKVRNLAEKTKINLSKREIDEPEIEYSEDYVSVTVTRSEFEAQSSGLLERTIEKTRKILADHIHQQPELILLTGGASQMPMVQKAMEKAFPQFAGKIKQYRPSKAIAYGAARFGTSERNTDIQTETKTSSLVQQRVAYDIGISYVRMEDIKEKFIDTCIPAGTPIPYEGDFRESKTILDKQRYSLFAVYEAKKQNPDPDKVDEDYTEIMSVTLDHGSGVDKGTPSMARLCIDKLNRLKIEAYDVIQGERNKVDNTVELKNLS